MPKQVIYIAVGLLFLGVFSLPYGYYMLLRLIIFGVFAWAAFLSFEQNEELLPWVFIIIAIIFNPIFKIYLPKEVWIIIDIVAGAILLLTQNKLKINTRN